MDRRSNKPAPPPPSKHSYGSLRSTSQTTVASNGTPSGKETVIVVQRKNTKKVPSLMRKFKIDKKKNPGPGDAQPGAVANGPRMDTNVNNTNNTSGGGIRRLTVTSSILRHTQSRASYQPMQSRPMIIRPGSNHIKKKEPPPRPPPPKVAKPKSSGPPSYDDVLRADLTAFMGDAKAPRLKPPAPKRPISLSVSSKQNDLLIDFDASPPSSSSVKPAPLHNRACQLPKSLLDFDIVVAPSQSQMPRSSSYAFGNSYSWNKGSNLTTSEYKDSHRSGSGDLLRGDDWLQSCLKDSVNANKAFVDRRGDAINAKFNGVASSPPPPPLPPRPRIIQGSTISPRARTELFETVDNRSPSPEPPTSSPPPVPPLPVDDMFQLEGDDDDVMPPLPPRPKSHDLTPRPHAIALYDYNSIQDGDLSLRVGDVVLLIDQVNDEWLYGVIEEREGLFPKNFVDIIVPVSGPDHATQAQTMSGPRCRAIYEFMAEDVGELSFGVGEVLALTGRVGNEWFRGKLRGKEGLFPVSFVEVLEEMPLEDQSSKISRQICVALYEFTASEPGEISLSEGDQIELTGHVNDDWLIGRILRTPVAEGRFPKNFVQLL